MNTPRTTKKLVAGLGATIGLLLTAGVAEAAWTSTGSGTATAKAGTSSALSTTAAAVTTGLLYPGGAGDVVITINNPNPFPITVTTITGSGTVTGAGGIGTCSNTAVSFSNRIGLTLAVPASGSATHTLAGAAAMGNTAGNTSDNGCQGATFTIPVSVTGQSG